MTTTADQCVLPTGLFLSPEDAARLLCTSRARLAELTLSGELNRTTRGYDRDAVERLAQRWATHGSIERTGRLSRMPDKVLWLLHDWGGSGTLAGLQSALNSAPSSVKELLRGLRQQGYVVLNRGHYQLTDQAWQYTRRFLPPT